MMKLEKIVATKEILDQLADGINPLDGSKLAQEDVTNQVEVVRALFAASQILEQVIASGGRIGERSKKKQREFVLTDEGRANLVPYSEAVHAGKIILRINEQLANADAKIKTKALLRWLEDINVLWEDENEGKRRLSPTDFGSEIGVYTEEINLYGPKTVLMFSPSAQQFVFDNIDSLLASAKPAALPARYMAPWTEEEQETLRTLHTQGASLKEMAHTLERSRGAIRARLKLLGLMQ